MTLGELAAALVELDAKRLVVGPLRGSRGGRGWTVSLHVHEDRYAVGAVGKTLEEAIEGALKRAREER